MGHDAWRVFRIMGEFVEGFEKLNELGPCVSIFGSARIRSDDPMYLACVETARRLGEAGFGIVTGGGPGIMEAANRGARLANAPSIGCNIELPFEQHLNPYVDIEIDFRYFFVRKTMFVKYAEGFIIFPGGFGTMDELFEALTLIQTESPLRIQLLEGAAGLAGRDRRRRRKDLPRGHPPFVSHGLPRGSRPAHKELL
jgi:uncharacterized protein (TIGR00730 family)